jgi:hypothetical protein
MPERVVFELTGEEKDLLGAVQRMQREFAKLEEQNRKLAQQAKEAARAAKEANKEQSSTLSSGIAQVASLAAGYLTAAKAIDSVTAALEHKARVEKGIAQAQLGIAPAQREFIINAGAITAKERDAALGEIDQIANRRNITRVDALRGAGAGIGFAGQVQPTLKALDVAAQFNPYDVAAMTPGLLATRNVTRSEDPLENLGFLVGVQQTSPIKSTSLLTENLIPAAAGVRLYGDTDVEAAALVNALSFALTDPTGQQSGTAAQRLSAVLAKQLPQLKSTRERVEFLQKNPKAAQRAGEGIEQGATKAALVSLITDSQSQASVAFRESLASIPAAGERRAVAEAAIANASGTSEQQLSNLSRGLGAGVENLQFTGSGISGVFQEELPKIRDFAGLNYFEQLMGNLPYRANVAMGLDPVDAGIKDIRAIESRVERRLRDELGEKNVPAEERRVYEAQLTELRAIVKELEGLRSENTSKADLQRALRQNAPNDLNTHTEGR